MKHLAKDIFGKVIWSDEARMILKSETSSDIKKKMINDSLIFVGFKRPSSFCFYLFEDTINNPPLPWVKVEFVPYHEIVIVGNPLKKDCEQDLTYFRFDSEGMSFSFWESIRGVWGNISLQEVF